MVQSVCGRRPFRRSAVVLFAAGLAVTAEAKLVNLADWTAEKLGSRDAMYESCVTAGNTKEGGYTPNVLFDGVLYKLQAEVTSEWKGTVAADGSCSVTFTVPASVPDADLPALDRYLIHRSPFWYSQSGSPTKWVLEGRNGEGEDWTAIDRVDVGVFDRRGGGQESPACECAHARALASRVTYRSYRLTFLETLIPSANIDTCSLQEIQLVVDDGTSGTVRYVSPDGTGAGTSWSDPAGLQDALTAAEAGDELWLKAGDYALAAELSAPTACAILGGFAGTETDKAQRDAAARSTIVGTAVENALVMTDTSFNDYVLERLVFTNALHRALKLGAYGDSSVPETMKSGAGLRAKDCAFVCNGTTLQATFTNGIRGRGAWIYTPKGTAVVFEDCVFDRNRNLYTASKRHNISMNGMALNANFCELTLTRCAFTDNGVPETVTTDGADGRDGTRGAAIYAYSATVKATDCVFRGNRALTNNMTQDGSIVVVEGLPDGTNSFVGCLFVGNSYARCGDSTSSTVEFAPGTVGRVTAFPILFDRCTVAYNLGQSCGGVKVDNASLVVRNSVFYGNFMQSTLAVAADVEVSASSTADVDWSLFAARSHLGGTGAIACGSGVVYGDPLFRTPLATVAAQVSSSPVAYPLHAKPGYFSPSYDLKTIDVHVEDKVSPAIDAGDPSADCSNEPSPNGGRLNLGFYGNTSEAAVSSTAVPAVVSSSVTFGADYTKPTVSLALAEADDPYSATVLFCCGYEKPAGEDETGWAFVETLASGAAPGATLEVLTKRYLEAGRTLWWRIVVRSGAGAAVVDSPAEGVAVGGELPPLWGKGLGEGYVHVRAGATGLGDGSDWLNAAATVVDAVALVDGTRTNLAVAGTVPVGTAAMGALSLPVSVFGGFRGDETSFAARSSERSTIDGEDAAKTCLVIANASGCTRVDGIAFTRSTGVAVSKTLAGDVTFANCRFHACGSPADTTLKGRTLKADGAGAATLTLEGCVFDRNWGRKGGYTDSFTGTAGYLTSFAKVDVSDTLYATNGFDHVNDGTANGREGLNGSTLYVCDSPLTLTNCRFVGNRYVVHNGSQTHCCALQVTGSSPTTLRNCLFTGNGGYATELETTFSPKRSGAAVFDLKTSDLAVAVESCTFAYNVSTKGHAVALQVDKGALTVRNSVFWRNQFNTNLTGACGADLYVGKSATAAVAYSLFTGTAAPWVYAETDGAVTWGEGVLTGDPLFVTTTDEYLSHLAEDTDTKGCVRLRFTDGSPFFSHHLRSRAGYIDETTGLRVARLGRVSSPAIDAGDPAADCSNEPVTDVAPRLNLGFYGNTPWATDAYRPKGLCLIIQ